jgi:lipopolysaccharide export system protein LptA
MKNIKFIIAFVALFCCSNVVFAQGLDFTSKNSNAPIEITADNGIEWHQKSGKIIAKENVVAKKGNVSLKCDEMTALYREKENGNMEVYRMEAKGNVTIKSPKEKAIGSYADYDIDKALMVLKGAPAQILTPTETISASEAIEYWQVAKKAVARGKVLAKQGNKTIRADVLSAFFKNSKKGAFELYRAEGYGNVLIKSGKSSISGDKGIYSPNAFLASLKGNVVISQGKNSLKGEYAEMDLKTGISRLKAVAKGSKKKGKVKGKFIPNSLKD